MGRPMLIFSKKNKTKKGHSITGYINFYGSDSLLTTLTTLFCKNTRKKQSLVSTLTTLIHEKIVSSLTTLDTLDPSLNSLTKLIFNTQGLPYNKKIHL